MSTLWQRALVICVVSLGFGATLAAAEPTPGAQIAPPEQPPPATLDDQGLEQVTVFGERALRQARQRVITAFEQQGWRAKESRSGDTVLRPPRAWMGRAHLNREGELWFNTPAIAFNGVNAMAPAAVDEPDMQTLSRDAAGQSIGMGGNFALPSATKQASAHKRILDAIGPELGQYHRMIAANAMKSLLDELPMRLDALWTDGAPLQGEALVVGAPARRAAILRFWGTRADTPEGLEVSRAVETWASNTLEQSAEWPTDAEIAQAQALRADRRSFPRREEDPPIQEE